MRLITGARWRLGPADLMALADWARYLARQRERASAEPATADDLITAEGQPGAREP